LKFAGGIAGEEHAVFAVADGALDLAEFGPVSHLQPDKPAAAPRRCDVEAALGGGSAKIVAEDEFEIGEAVVAAQQQAVAEKQQAGGVGQRLGEDGKIDAANAGAKGQKAENRRQHARQQNAISMAKGKLENGFQNGQRAPAQENQKVGIGL
jgi:hypothetical protein